MDCGRCGGVGCRLWMGCVEVWLGRMPEGGQCRLKKWVELTRLWSRAARRYEY